MSRFVFALACLACVGYGRRNKHVPSQASMVLADYLLAVTPPVAFERSPSFASRRATPQMSHFSKVQTKFFDKDLLAKSLKDLGYNVLVAETEKALTVRGYQGKQEEAQIVIEQENKHDIGFKYNGEAFELVSDLQFWQQPTPVDVFLQKLTKKYAVNTIMSKAEEDDFNLAELEEDEIGKVTMKLQRYGTPTR